LQVYHPLGVESTAINETHLNPHCTVCNSSANETYLVSCALCNSTFHTSCVGLGAVIPEDEFYCSDCQTCREEYSKTHPAHDDSQYVDQETREKIRKIRRGYDSISIADIVADIRGEDMANRPSNAQSARIGGRRELLELRVDALRESWPALGSGSVTYQDVLSQFPITESMRQNNPAAPTSSAGRENHSRESHDVERAWEKMEKAMLDLPKKTLKQTSRSFTMVRNPESIAHRRPPMRKSRPYGESVSAPHLNHQVPQPNGGFGKFSSTSHALSGSRDQRQKGPMHGVPLGASSRAPQMGASLLMRGVSFTIEKRECARFEDAKAEIQSLVKNGLSALPKDKRKLGIILSFLFSCISDSRHVVPEIIIFIFYQS
jgi:PHD-finger